MTASISIFCAAFFAALAIVAPQDGAVVPTQNEVQKRFFSVGRENRNKQISNDEGREALRNAGSKQLPLRLAWTGETNDVVYALKVVREGGATEAFSITNRTFAYITNLELGTRYHWSVFDGRDVAAGTFTTEPDAPRFLHAEGVGNFRDVGGWKTVDGRHRVRQNMIFRSAGLRARSRAEGGLLGKKKVTLGERRVTDAGIATLHDEFKIKTDLELRTPQETVGMETSVIGPDVKWINISFAAYEYIDSNSRGKKPFARLFKLFADESCYPILFHCSGGRDRTGTLAFLLNGLLGVSEGNLIRDWQSTGFFTSGSRFTSDMLTGFLEYLKSYPGDTLQEKIEVYAKSCGVTDDEIAAFRKIMLEDIQPDQSTQEEGGKSDGNEDL